MGSGSIKMQPGVTTTGKSAAKPIFLVSPGADVEVAVTTQITVTTEDALTGFTPEERGCYACHEVNKSHWTKSTGYLAGSIQVSASRWRYVRVFSSKSKFDYRSYELWSQWVSLQLLKLPVWVSNGGEWGAEEQNVANVLLRQSLKSADASQTLWLHWHPEPSRITTRKQNTRMQKAVEVITSPAQRRFLGGCLTTKP